MCFLARERITLYLLCPFEFLGEALNQDDNVGSFQHHIRESEVTWVYNRQGRAPINIKFHGIIQQLSDMGEIFRYYGR